MSNMGMLTFYTAAQRETPTFGIGKDTLLHRLYLLQLVRIKTTNTFQEGQPLLLSLDVFGD